MLYGTPQPGFNPSPNQGLNLTEIIPGDYLTLLSPADPPGVNRTSVAVVRGPAPGFTDNGITFYVTGAPSGTTVDIQGSNIDIDGDYYTLATISPNASGNGAYTDAGRAAFYRAKISAYTTGAMPTVTTQR